MRAFWKYFLLVALSCLPLMASGQGKAVVNLPVNFMREAPDYTAEMGTQALMGTVVNVLDSDGYWRYIETPDGYKAWANALGLVPMSDDRMAEYENASKLIVTADHSQVYADADEESSRVSPLLRGDVLREVLIDGKLLVKRGFCCVMLPSGKVGWMPKEDAMDRDKWFASRDDGLEDVVAEALRFVGVPYLWGGGSPDGFDCSGLTQFAFYMSGIQLPRNTGAQVKCGAEVDVSGVQNGDFSNLRRGDLLFFVNEKSGRVNHVAIYLGDGKIVHSSQLVRVNSLRRGDPDCYEGVGRLRYGRRMAEFFKQNAQ